MPVNAAKEMFEPFSERVQVKLQEGVDASKQALKNVREKAGDLLDDATHNLKRHPWESVGAALIAGAVIGLAAGFFVGKALARPRRRFFVF